MSLSPKLAVILEKRRQKSDGDASDNEKICEEASDVTEYIDESEEYLTSDSELESSEDKSEKHCRNMNLELDAESDSGKEEILNLEMDLILDCQEEEPMASPESKKSEVDVDLNENDINESDKTDWNSNETELFTSSEVKNEENEKVMIGPLDMKTINSKLLIYIKSGKVGGEDPCEQNIESFDEKSNHMWIQ